MIGAATASCELTQMLLEVMLGLNNDNHGILNNGLKQSELGQNETLKHAKIILDKITNDSSSNGIYQTMQYTYLQFKRPVDLACRANKDRTSKNLAMMGCSIMKKLFNPKLFKLLDEKNENKDEH